MPAPISIDGDLVLHPVSLHDAAELYAAVDRNREHLRQWLPWIAPDYALEDTIRFITERAEENADRTALTMVIRERERLCGAIGLHRFDPRHRATSIGYWIGSESEGCGLVTRACRAMVSTGFREYGLHRIEIRCATGNARSSGIPRRLGFTEEGVLREAEWLYDHWVDLRVFSKLESESQ